MSDLSRSFIILGRKIREIRMWKVISAQDILEDGRGGTLLFHEVGSYFFSDMSYTYIGYLKKRIN